MSGPLERLAAIEYHIAQLSTYIAQSTISERNLASARHHAKKIAGLAATEQVSA